MAGITEPRAIRLLDEEHIHTRLDSRGNLVQSSEESSQLETTNFDRWSKLRTYLWTSLCFTICRTLPPRKAPS